MSDTHNERSTTTPTEPKKDPLLNFEHPVSGADFKKHVNRVGDYIVDYYENKLQNLDGKHEFGSIPVCSRVQPGYLQQLIPKEAPQQGESFDDILKDVTEKIIPGVTHWQHPNFFSVCDTERHHQ